MESSCPLTFYIDMPHGTYRAASRLKKKVAIKALCARVSLLLSQKPRILSFENITGLTDGRTNGRTDGRTDGRMDGRKDGRTVGRTDGRMAGWKDGRMNGRESFHSY